MALSWVGVFVRDNVFVCGEDWRSVVNICISLHVFDEETNLLLLYWLTPGARRAFVAVTNASTFMVDVLLLTKTAHDTKTGTRCDRCIVCV